MAKETDIKSLGIFGNNSGLARIKEVADKKKEEELYNNKLEKNSNIRWREEVVQKKGKKSVGAPIKRFDRVYTAKSPLKLSALLNSTSRNLVEKYETELSRDELLRKALNEYIKQHLSLEDKQELYNAVLKDLDLFREKYATIPEVDEYKNVIKTAKEIEEETKLQLKQQWGIR